MNPLAQVTPPKAPLATPSISSRLSLDRFQLRQDESGIFHTGRMQYPGRFRAPSNRFSFIIN